MLVLLITDCAVCRLAGDISFHGTARMASSRAVRLDVASLLDCETEILELSWLDGDLPVGGAACALAARTAVKTNACQQRLLTATPACVRAASSCSGPVI